MEALSSKPFLLAPQIMAEDWEAQFGINLLKVGRMVTYMDFSYLCSATNSVCNGEKICENVELGRIYHYGNQRKEVWDKCKFFLAVKHCMIG